MFNPKIIGISLMEPQAKFAWIFLERLKREDDNYIIIVGGPHATMAPEEVLSKIGVNIVIQGEGEQSILNVIRDINKDRCTPNDKFLIKPGPLRSLSSLPPEDLSIFPFDQVVKGKNNMFSATIGRGCVYSCSYCINKSYLDKFNFKVKDYIRMKPFRNVLSEIKPYITDDVRFIGFEDDDFLIYDKMMPDKLEEFYKEYKAKIGLPFSINANLHSVTEDNILAFKDAGGFIIRVGIESSERLRKEVLNRQMTNKFMYEKLFLLQRYGIEISTYNMIGLPHERKEDVEELFDINALFQPSFIKIMTFYPFKSTPIYNMCIEEDLIDEERLKGINNYDSISGLKFNAKYHDYLKFVRDHFDDMLNYRIEKLTGKYIKLTNSVAKYIPNEKSN
jgi:radical SAM superfamily enzyme YgiQ (UPF0313 family)